MYVSIHDTHSSINRFWINEHQLTKIKYIPSTKRDPGEINRVRIFILFYFILFYPIVNNMAGNNPMVKKLIKIAK